MSKIISELIGKECIITIEVEMDIMGNNEVNAKVVRGGRRMNITCLYR